MRLRIFFVGESTQLKLRAITLSPRQDSNIELSVFPYKDLNQRICPNNGHVLL